MAILRLFASAREAAGLTSDQIDGPTVEAVLDEACRRYGERFSAVLGISKVWVNGEPAEPLMPVDNSDVVAVLPPVSGGASGLQTAAEPVMLRRGVPASRPSAVDMPGATVKASPPVKPSATAKAGATGRAGSPVKPGSAPNASGATAGARRNLRPPIVRGNLALVAEPERDFDPITVGQAQPDPVTADDPGSERPSLAVVHHSVGPHGRLGLVWAAATAGATVAGPSWLAGWLALTALVAATQTAGVWRKRGERPITALAAGIAVALPIASSFGAVDAAAMNGVIVVGVVAAFATRLFSASPKPTHDIALTLAIGVPIGLAAASPVLVRHGGIIPALLLLGFAATYDAGAYLIGTGAASAWEGPAAGVAALVPLTIFAAVIFIPPFSGVEPLLLGLLAAALAPLGPVAGSALLGGSTDHAPGLRRLDSLLVLGPIWAWAALIFLR